MEFKIDRLADTLLRRMPDAVVYSDAEGLIRFWNGGAELIFGFRADEAQGQSLNIHHSNLGSVGGLSARHMRKRPKAALGISINIAMVSSWRVPLQLAGRRASEARSVTAGAAA